MKLHVLREAGGPAYRTLPAPVPSPLPRSASGGGVYLEGESKCIWSQLYLPRWVAVRLDCVTLDYVTPHAALPKTGLSAQGSTPILSLLHYMVML